VGLINLEPALEPGEQERWRRPAALCLADATVAGTLHLTSLGLVFVPNRLNRPGRRQQLRIPAAQISEAGVAHGQLSLANRNNGGMRPRLRILTDAHETQLFLINHPEQVAAELEALL